MSCCTSTCTCSCSHGVYLCYTSRADGDGARCRLWAGVFSRALCPGTVSRPSHPQRLRLPDQTTGVLRKTDCGAAGCYWGWRAPRQNGTLHPRFKRATLQQTEQLQSCRKFVCSLLIMLRYIWKSPVLCVSRCYVLTAYINTALNTPIGVHLSFFFFLQLDESKDFEERKMIRAAMRDLRKKKRGNGINKRSSVSG